MSSNFSIVKTYGWFSIYNDQQSHTAHGGNPHTLGNSTGLRCEPRLQRGLKTGEWWEPWKEVWGGESPRSAHPCSAIRTVKCSVPDCREMTSMITLTLFILRNTEAGMVNMWPNIEDYLKSYIGMPLYIYINTQPDTVLLGEWPTALQEGWQLKGGIYICIYL